MTAVDVLWENLTSLFFFTDGIPIEVKERYEQYKELEKQQHGQTWDAAIKAHDERGHVHARSIVDFDEYFEQTFKK
jgi:hypothetical protein